MSSQTARTHKTSREETKAVERIIELAAKIREQEEEERHYAMAEEVDRYKEDDAGDNIPNIKQDDTVVLTWSQYSRVREALLVLVAIDASGDGIGCLVGELLDELDELYPPPEYLPTLR